MKKNNPQYEYFMNGQSDPNFFADQCNDLARKGWEPAGELQCQAFDSDLYFFQLWKRPTTYKYAASRLYDIKKLVAIEDVPSTPFFLDLEDAESFFKDLHKCLYGKEEDFL